MKAYLQITMKINSSRRPAVAEVYGRYKEPFLSAIDGALSKELLIREEDVQVLHGFDTIENAQKYLTSPLFQEDVFLALEPLWSAEPDVRLYTIV